MDEEKLSFGRKVMIFIPYLFKELSVDFKKIFESPQKIIRYLAKPSKIIWVWCIVVLSLLFDWNLFFSTVTAFFPKKFPQYFALIWMVLLIIILIIYEWSRGYFIKEYRDKKYQEFMQTEPELINNKPK